MTMLLLCVLLFLGLYKSTILRSKDLQSDISSKFFTLEMLEKVKLVDKEWIDVGKVFTKITPTRGLFKYKQENEILFQAKENTMSVSELSRTLTHLETDRIFIQNLIEEKEWNKLFFKMIQRTYEFNKVFLDFQKSLAGIVDYYEVDNNGQTCLHFATKNQTLEIDLVKILLKYEPQIDATIHKHKHPLSLFYRCLDPIKKLSTQDKFAKINLKDKDGRTALHLAANFRTAELIEIFVKFGAEVDAIDNNLQTPLMIAAERGNCDVLKALLSGGAKCNLRNRFDETALRTAAVRKRADIIKILIKHGKEELETPLMWAAEFGRSVALKTLLVRQLA